MSFKSMADKAVRALLLFALSCCAQGCDEDEPPKTSWTAAERAASCSSACDIYGRRYVPGGCAQIQVEDCNNYMYPAGHEVNCTDGLTNVVQGIHPSYTAFVPCHVRGGTCVANFACGDSPGTCDPSWEGSQCPEPCAEGRIRENRVCVCAAGTIEDEESGECLAMSAEPTSPPTGGTVDPGETDVEGGGTAAGAQDESGGTTGGMAQEVMGGVIGGTTPVGGIADLGGTDSTADQTVAGGQDAGGSAAGGGQGMPEGGVVVVGGSTGGSPDADTGGSQASVGGAGGMSTPLGGHHGTIHSGGQDGAELPLGGTEDTSTISACGQTVLAYLLDLQEPPQTTTECFAGGPAVGDFADDEVPPVIGACETCGFNSDLSALTNANDCVTCSEGYEIQQYFFDCTGFCVPEGTSTSIPDLGTCMAPVECVYTTHQASPMGGMSADGDDATPGGHHQADEAQDVVDMSNLDVDPASFGTGGNQN